jgi:cysteine-rich repeat protein
LCTINETCLNGACVGDAVGCDDDNPCTDDTCDPLAGCGSVPNNLACEDGDACTENDQCSGGTCSVGTPITCDDANTCTTDACDAITGCFYEFATPCCGNNELEAGEECDDGNQETDDDCNNTCSYNYSVEGSFDIGSGPNWTTNPTTYSCTEACAVVFGGDATEFHCSTSDTVLDHLAYLDGWNDTQFCTQPTDQDFKAGINYDCGVAGCSYSAYVEDHTENNPSSVCQKTNWCWKKK